VAQYTEILGTAQVETLEADATLAAMEAQFTGAIAELDRELSEFPEVKERVALETFDKTAAYSDTNSGYSC
jgi:hypothetical protein